MRSSAALCLFGQRSGLLLRPEGRAGHRCLPDLLQSGPAFTRDAGLRMFFPSQHPLSFIAASQEEAGRPSLLPRRGVHVKVHVNGASPWACCQVPAHPGGSSHPDMAFCAPLFISIQTASVGRWAATGRGESSRAFFQFFFLSFKHPGSPVTRAEESASPSVGAGSVARQGTWEPWPAPSGHHYVLSCLHTHRNESKNELRD